MYISIYTWHCQKVPSTPMDVSKLANHCSWTLAHIPWIYRFELSYNWCSMNTAKESSLIQYYMAWDNEYRIWITADNERPELMKAEQIKRLEMNSYCRNKTLSQCYSASWHWSFGHLWKLLDFCDAAVLFLPLACYLEMLLSRDMTWLRNIYVQK